MVVMNRRYSALRTEIRIAARYGRYLIDQFRQDPTPAKLDEYQHGLRQGILEIESRIRNWKETRARRQRLVNLVRSRRGVGSPDFGRYQELCEEYERALERLRQLLRQIGDALSWNVLKEDSRLIRLLFAKRTHHLPQGHGIVGPIQVITTAHKTGKFLVIDNDVTRCLGLGDLTVVRAGAQRGLPLSVELKTRDPKSRIEEGSALTISFVTPLTGERAQTQLHDDFVEALGLSEGTPEQHVRPGVRRKRQEEQMIERAELVMRGIGGERERVQTNQGHWASIKAVAERAMIFGTGYDIPAQGVALLATKEVESGPSPASHLQQLLNLIQADGFDRHDCWAVTTDDLANDDTLSAIIAPVALWPVPAIVRQDILSRDVVLAAVVRNDVWRNAFSIRGIRLSDDGQGGWVLETATKKHTVDAIEVTKLQFGVALNGVNPNAVAAAIAG